MSECYKHRSSMACHARNDLPSDFSKFPNAAFFNTDTLPQRNSSLFLAHERKSKFKKTASELGVLCDFNQSLLLPSTTGKASRVT